MIEIRIRQTKKENVASEFLILSKSKKIGKICFRYTDAPEEYEGVYKIQYKDFNGELVSTTQKSFIRNCMKYDKSLRYKDTHLCCCPYRIKSKKEANIK